MLKINLDSHSNKSSPALMSILPSSLFFLISIFKPRGDGREKNFVVFDVMAGIENVLDEKSKEKILFFFYVINIPFPPLV